nr:hypothetical protein [Bacteroidota bacterium]
MKVFKFSLLLLISVLLNNSLYSQVQFSIYPNGIDTICHGESLKVEAKAGYSSYHWSNGKTTRIIEVNKAGLYKCTATDQYHQTHVDSLMVYMFPKKNLSIYSNPKPAVICKGAELVLEASPGFKIYHWSNGKKGDRIVITPTLSHWLILIAVDSNACHYRDSIHIKVKICDSCDIITAWPGTSICK